MDGIAATSMRGWERRIATSSSTSGIYPGTDPVYRGESELRRFWEIFREPWESLHVRVDETREIGDEVVALCTFEGHARDGMTVRREVGWIFRFVSDQVVRADAYGSWKEALEAGPSG